MHLGNLLGFYLMQCILVWTCPKEMVYNDENVLPSSVSLMYTLAICIEILSTEFDLIWNAPTQSHRTALQPYIVRMHRNSPHYEMHLWFLTSPTSPIQPVNMKLHFPDQWYPNTLLIIINILCHSEEGFSFWEVFVDWEQRLSFGHWMISFHPPDFGLEICK